MWQVWIHVHIQSSYLRGICIHCYIYIHECLCLKEQSNNLPKWIHIHVSVIFSACLFLFLFCFITYFHYIDVMIYGVWKHNASKEIRRWTKEQAGDQRARRINDIGCLPHEAALMHNTHGRCWLAVGVLHPSNI